MSIKISHFREAWIIKWREKTEIEGKTYSIQCQIWVSNQQEAINIAKKVAKEGKDYFIENERAET